MQIKSPEVHSLKVNTSRHLKTKTEGDLKAQGGPSISVYVKFMVPPVVWI